MAPHQAGQLPGSRLAWPLEGSRPPMRRRTRTGNAFTGGDLRLRRVVSARVVGDRKTREELVRATARKVLIRPSLGMGDQIAAVPACPELLILGRGHEGREVEESGLDV